MFYFNVIHFRKVLDFINTYDDIEVNVLILRIIHLTSMATEENVCTVLVCVKGIEWNS